MEFSVLDAVDEALVREESSQARASRTPAVWPSEASAIRVDKSLWEIAGKCHRAAYYRMMGFKAAPVDVTGAWRFVTGRQIENHLTALAKLSDPKIWVANSVKVFVPEVYLSLELDIVTRDPNTSRAWILECKTIYGYTAHKKVFQDGQPRLENLMQSCMYLLEVGTGKRLKEVVQHSLEERARLDAKGNPHRNRCEANLDLLAKVEDGPLGAKLIYIARDDCARKEFDVGIYQDFDGSHYPLVDGVPFRIFSIESIYTRYKTLQNYWFRARIEAVRRLSDQGTNPPESVDLVLDHGDMGRRMTDGSELTRDDLAAELNYYSLLEDEVRSLPDSYLPPPEYEWSYSPERTERLRAAGEIAKSSYKNFKDKKLSKLGDFACNYCGYRNHCIRKQNPGLAYLLHDLSNLAEEVEAEIG